MRVILGPGLASGLAAIGVLMELEARRIPVSKVVGVNTGALVAALWATQQDLEMVTNVLSHLPWQKFRVATSLGHADPLLKAILLLTKEARLEDAPRKMAVVARRRSTYESQLIHHGIIAHAVRSGMAVPGLFHPIWPRDHDDFVDAGAHWWQALGSNDKSGEVNHDQETLWVIPRLIPATMYKDDSARENGLTFPAGVEDLAAYIGADWSWPGKGSGEMSVVQIEAVGGMLSFDKASEWVAAGKDAVTKWLENEKELFA